MAPLHISISAEPLFAVAGVTITNSILTTWIVIALLSLLAIVLNRRLVGDARPTRLQSAIEFLVENIQHFIESIAGPVKAKLYFPLIATLFFFILFSNWSGLIPGAGTIGQTVMLHGESTFVPYFRAPTADLNTTLALALITMVMVQVYGFRFLGLGYMKKFVDVRNPINFFVGLLELLSEFSKVISFAFRLFGNIIAGEILLLVMAFLLPYLGPTPFLGLEIFVGFIQALVFMMLTTVFCNMATIGHSEDHSEHNK